MSDTAGFTTLRELMQALAKAMNLVSPDIEHHHEQTAYLALFIARAANLPEEDAMLAMVAALLHDIGSFVSESPQLLADVESNAREVAQVGSNMLSDLPGLEDASNVIAYCQCSWGEVVTAAIEQGETCERLGRIASIVHLADAVSVMLNPEEPVLNQASEILSMAKRFSGTEFCPDAVEAFETISELEYVWMDIAHNPMFLTYFTGDIAVVSLEQTVRFTGLMSRIIDYRSPFTAMHSAGVAASARELALLAGMSEEDVLKMQIAGNLHDVGKLAVPRSILEKPGRLTDAEFNVIKEHPYYTSLVLLGIPGFEDEIWPWAANHHEKLNGKGYPFHRKAHELGTGERILAVADIFSAITEERPYRAGMTREQAADVLQGDVRNGGICGDLVALLLDNYEQVDSARDCISHLAGKRYFDSLGQR